MKTIIETGDFPKELQKENKVGAYFEESTKEEISFHEAVEIVMNRCNRLNCYQEYVDGYYFYLNDGNYYIGGEESGFVVLKKDGTIEMPYIFFADKKYDTTEIGGEILFS